MAEGHQARTPRRNPLFRARVRPGRRRQVLPIRGGLMKPSMPLNTLLATAGQDPERGRILFALINLGIIESLASGVLGAADAVRLFYNADNCFYVQKS